MRGRSPCLQACETVTAPAFEKLHFLYPYILCDISDGFNVNPGDLKDLISLLKINELIEKNRYTVHLCGD